jgi:hypothetical protein
MILPIMFHIKIEINAYTKLVLFNLSIRLYLYNL